MFTRRCGLDSSQDNAEWSAPMNTAKSLVSIETANFLHQQSDYQLLNKYSALQSRFFTLIPPLTQNIIICFSQCADGSCVPWFSCEGLMHTRRGRQPRWKGSKLLCVRVALYARRDAVGDASKNMAGWKPLSVATSWGTKPRSHYAGNSPSQVLASSLLHKGDDVSTRLSIVLYWVYVASRKTNIFEN